MIMGALREITKNLRRSATEEFTRCYAARRPDLSEMAAQLKHELDHVSDMRTLREYWSRADLLQCGALFPKALTEDASFPQREFRSQTQGLKEIMALWTIIDVERRVNEADEEAAAGDRGKAHAGQSEPHDEVGAYLRLFRKPFRGGNVVLNVGVGLLSAAIVVGLVLSISHNPILALLGASITGIITTLIMSYVSSHESEKGLMPGVNVPSYDRTLPVVVERLYEAGIAPIFVVDELDKVDRVSEQLKTLFTKIKHFLSGRAFFIFVTDSSYIEELETILADGHYPVEQTFFADRLPVYHTPGELYEYLGKILVPTGEKEEAAEGVAAGKAAAEREAAGKVAAEKEAARTAGKETLEKAAGTVAPPATEADALERLKRVVVQRCKLNIGEIGTRLAPYVKNNIVQLGSFMREDDLALRYACLMQAAVETVLMSEEAVRLQREKPQLAYLILDLVYRPSWRWERGENGLAHDAKTVLNDVRENRGQIPAQYASLFLEWHEAIVQGLLDPNNSKHKDLPPAVEKMAERTGPVAGFERGASGPRGRTICRGGLQRGPGSTRRMPELCRTPGRRWT